MPQMQHFEAFIHQIMLLWILVILYLIIQSINQGFLFHGGTGNPVEHDDASPSQEEQGSPVNSQAIGSQKVTRSGNPLSDYVCQQHYENLRRKRQKITEELLNQQKLSENGEEFTESPCTRNINNHSEESGEKMVTSKGLEASKNNTANDWNGKKPKEVGIITQDSAQEQLEYGSGFACHQLNENVIRRRKNINEALRNPQRLPERNKELMTTTCQSNKEDQEDQEDQCSESMVNELSNDSKTVDWNGARPKKLTKSRCKKKKKKRPIKNNQPKPTCFVDSSLPIDVDTLQGASSFQAQETTGNRQGPTGTYQNAAHEECDEKHKPDLTCEREIND